MEEAGVGRRLLLEELDSAITYPPPHLSRHKSCEHDQEPSANLLPEYGHGKACFGDGKPSSLRQLLDLDGSQRAETESRQGIDEAAV